VTPADTIDDDKIFTTTSVTRAFPDRDRGGPKIMAEVPSGEKELPIVPRQENWGRITWKP
jgi:hypothetical protein